MFLTIPTIEELQKLDMPLLVDMLAYETNLHFKLVRTEGVTNTARACKESIENIQAAIEMKRKLDKYGTNTAPGISFTQNRTPIDPAA